MRTTIIAVAALALLGGAVLAQTHGGHGSAGHGSPSVAAPAASASTAGYRAANARMHKDMDIAYTGDADVDFARGMIPHHQGAIDMAKVVLQHGKDPELKKLAEEIVSTQETEIAFIQAWLRKKGR